MKRKRGRPKADPPNAKQIHVCVTLEMYERLHAAATQAGLSLSGWMRWVCIQKAADILRYPD